MNTILCSFPCKYQKDGYCWLNEPCKAKNSGDVSCIYYEPKADEDIISPSNEKEPL